MQRRSAGILLMLFAAVLSRAEVVDADAHGFTVRHSVTIDADRLDAYVAAVRDIGAWWNPDHTMSGHSANLYIDTAVPGCFCETLGQGAALAHLSVTFVNPGVLVRMTGGLGPLGLMGVAGNLTWEFESTEAGTVVTQQYAVGGYLAGGLDAVAPAVDSVLVEALERLKSYAETGDPAPPAGE